jgi:hypothetical protein
VLPVWPVLAYDVCSVMRWPLALWRGLASHPCSSVAQRQSIRLLTGGLLVRIQPEEPHLFGVQIFTTARFGPWRSVDSRKDGPDSIGWFWASFHWFWPSF